MSDLALIWDADDFSADLSVLNGDLQTDDGLKTAIIISLFTDRQAEPDDVLPTPSADRRGWWGDGYATVDGDRIGSRLWLLSRSKATPEVVLRAQEYAQEALAWLLEDKVASAVDVQAANAGNGLLAITVAITRPTGGPAQFDFVWNALS